MTATRTGCSQFLTATSGTAVCAQTIANVNDIDDKGLFDADIKIDLSLSYQATKSLSLVLFGQNIIKLTHAWDYLYIMESMSAVDEPTVVGLRANISSSPTGSICKVLKRNLQVML